MSFRIDHAPLPPRPVVPPPCVEPVVACSLDEHRLEDPDVFIPGAVPYADYIQRQNVLDRYADAVDVFRPERFQERGPSPAGGRDDAGRGRGGWPRLADVPSAEERIDRRVRVTYRYERILPAGTRIDVVG